MTMPTLSDLEKIFLNAAVSGHNNTHLGLLAVLDAIQPVVAEAARAFCPDSDDELLANERQTPDAYAARIIAYLKGDAAK